MSSAKRQFAFLLAVLTQAWVMAPASCTESLKDPTRPHGLVSQTEEAAPATVAGPVLQSVLVGPERTTAIISGKSVRVGDYYGNARVSRITDTEVTLMRGREEQVLKLFAGPKKRVHISPALRGTFYANGD